MLVGIYIPQQVSNARVYDRLEADYFRRALRVLRKVNKDTRFIWFSEQDTAPLCEGIQTDRIRRRDSLLHSLSGSAPTLEHALTLHNVDTLLTTIDAPAIRTRLPKVLFTLDMMIYDGSAPASGKLHPSQPRVVKRNCAEAQLILCPSVYVQKICSTQTEIGLEKTVLALAGVEDVFSKAQPSIIEGAYALFPLNRYTVRHINTFIEAIRRNKDLFPPTLVVIGQLRPDEPANWGLPVIRIELCPDDMLAALLQNAVAVLYPAQGDGGGVFALQALRAGARLITSKSGATFEVAGTTPFYCEADNPVSMLQVMRRMLGETSYEQEKRRQTGRTLVMDCTWERCAGRIVSAVKRSLL